VPEERQIYELGKDLEEAVKKAEYPEMKKSNSLLEKVKETIEKYQMFAIKARIVVGVSGGPDSTTLLHLLLQLRDEYELKLWIAHLNHQLRGKEAEKRGRRRG
jgi:tRNA(Ile)-lysidine synthase TilS/MesJ